MYCFVIWFSDMEYFFFLWFTHSPGTALKVLNLSWWCSSNFCGSDKKRRMSSPNLVSLYSWPWILSPVYYHLHLLLLPMAKAKSRGDMGHPCLVPLCKVKVKVCVLLNFRWALSCLQRAAITDSLTKLVLKKLILYLSNPSLPSF